MNITSDRHMSSAIHHELIKSIIETGACPSNSELADRLHLPGDQIQDALVALSEIHGIVLHPHVSEPWVIHPFSLTPTMHYIKGQRRSWWAPCVWCALGVATLVQGEVRLHTRIGGEVEPLIIRIVAGQPVGLEDIWVHFAIPPARAWQNVHQHCSMVLPFRSQEQIHEWCHRHRLPIGEAVPLHQVGRLAELWYGTYADVNWHKWTITEAQEIFTKAGLTSRFWALGDKKGEF